MRDLLNLVAKKLDKLDDKLDNVDKTLVKQEINLQEHMRRSDLLEKKQEEIEQEIKEDLIPINNHINQVKGITKFVIIGGPIIATIFGVLYKYFL